MPNQINQNGSSKKNVIKGLFITLSAVMALLIVGCQSDKSDKNAGGPKPGGENPIDEINSFRKGGAPNDIHGIYYSIPGFQEFVDGFPKIAANTFNADFVKIVNDSTAVYLKNDMDVTYDNTKYKIKKGDSLDIVIAFYWKLKNDPKTNNGGSDKDQFDFTIIPTLRIRDTNPRKGIIDYVEDSSFYNRKNDTMKNQSGKILLGTPPSNAYDNGQMYP